MKIRLLFFLGLTLSIIQAASAQTFTWIAGPVGEWSDGSNWSTGTAPGGPGTAIITNHGIARLSTANGGTEYLHLGTLGGDGLVEGTVIINASRQLVVSQSLVAGVNADAGGEIFTTGTLIARELILGQSGFGWLRLGTGGSVKVGFNPSPGGGPMNIAVNAGSSAIIDIEGGGRSRRQHDHQRSWHGGHQLQAERDCHLQADDHWRGQRDAAGSRHDDFHQNLHLHRRHDHQLGHPPTWRRGIQRLHHR